MSATVSGANLSLRPSMTRVIAAASIGNMLEWYDFIVYAVFAIPISHAFFPGKTDFTSLLETFITFGIGFLARPLGAILFGTYADRTGRRAGLTLTVLLMALSTLVIATCPTAATIGIAAPTLLVLARLLQGLSAGGEIGGAIALLVEYAPPSRRAFYSTFQEVGQAAHSYFVGLLRPSSLPASLSVRSMNGHGVSPFYSGCSLHSSASTYADTYRNRTSSSHTSRRPLKASRHV